MDLQEQEESALVDKYKQVHVQEYQEVSENKIQIGQIGLCKSTIIIPECVLNPGIPLIWFGCKYCSSIFKTTEERTEHKAKSHAGRRPKRRKLNAENHYSSSNAAIHKTFLSPPLPILQDSNIVDRLTKITTSKKDKLLEKVSSPSKQSMKKRHIRHAEEDDDAGDSPRIPCDCCTETFSNRKDLQRHKKLHSNDHHEKTINLGTPSNNFGNISSSIISRRNLERRAESSSGSSSSSSSQHFSDSDKNNNTNNNNNICPVCLKNFGFKDTLKRHLKGHRAQEEPEYERDSDDIPLLKSPRRETMKKTQSISHNLHPIHLLQAIKKGPKSSQLFRKSSEKKSQVLVVPVRNTPRRKLLISRSHLQSLSPDSVTASTSMF